MRSGLRPQPGPPRGLLPHEGWLGWTSMYEHVARTTLALLPLALLVVWAMARHRRLRGFTQAPAWRLSLAEVGIVYLTVPAVWLTMLPGAQAGQAPARVSLVPLRDLVTMSTTQVIGNLLLLAALGFFLPMRFTALGSVPRVLGIAAAGSTLIETAQYVLPLDRVSSVDDVLLNTVGAGLAALVSRPWWRSGGDDLEGLVARAGRELGDDRGDDQEAGDQHQRRQRVEVGD